MATISEILLAQGRHAADSRRRQGENSGQMWGNLANIISQTGQSIQREREEAPLRKQDAEMRELRIREGRASAQSAEREQIEDRALRELFAKPELPSPQELIATVGPERGTAIAKGLSALSPNPQQQYQDTQKTLRDVALGMHALPEALRAEYYPALRQNLVERQVIKPEDAPEEYDPQWWATTMSYGQEPPKQPALIQRDPTKDLSNPMTGEVVSKGTPEAPKPPGMREVVVRGPNGRPVKKLVSEAEMMQGVEQYQEPRQGAAAEPLVPIIGPDGQPVLVRRSQAEGKRPASNREQGRPVTSGDAGRVADFDTSLSDLGVLNKTLTETKGATGTSAAIGASLYPWITDATGWGTDAKKRQGVIDRVKQVIGKTLEGGVLRKEDEIKYEKILPTIKDTAAVAASKLAGLETAITQRRSTFMDALGDAGYDTSKFNARTPARTAPAAADPLGIR